MSFSYDVFFVKVFRKRDFYVDFNSVREVYKHLFNLSISNYEITSLKLKRTTGEINPLVGYFNKVCIKNEVLSHYRLCSISSFDDRIIWVKLQRRGNIQLVVKDKQVIEALGSQTDYFRDIDGWYYKNFAGFKKYV